MSYTAIPSPLGLSHPLMIVAAAGGLLLAGNRPRQAGQQPHWGNAKDADLNLMTKIRDFVV
jgi:hypothetical protein